MRTKNHWPKIELHLCQEFFLRLLKNISNQNHSFFITHLTVGTPVTRRPPHSPGRAVFPHPVLRLHSLSREPSQLPVTRLNRLFPAVRLAYGIRPYMSSISFLCELRASVRSFPVWLAFPTSRPPDLKEFVTIPDRKPGAIPYLEISLLFR